jgi:hypothetical protein
MKTGVARITLIEIESESETLKVSGKFNNQMGFLDTTLLDHQVENAMARLGD